MNTATSKTHPARRGRPHILHATTRAVILWALIMSPLLFWGLPTARDDDLLFGGQAPWQAERYGIEPDLQQRRGRTDGADTDLNPIADPERINDLTHDEPARAEILRRYRLFSRQPDEMIIFLALQQMDPRGGDLDPKLYQYGGGYIYLVGAAIGASSLLGITHLTSDAGYYLENPGQFARFYVVARFIALVFGALTLVAVHKLARRTAGHSAGWIAMLCVACSPVFITAVLEAKPHLPSACMILWAALSALDYQARGRWRDALRMGLQAGYACGLVLTGVVAALLWPLLLLRPCDRRSRACRRLLAAGGIALLVYVLTNPYVPWNLLTGNAAFASNISNSTAMYQDQMQRCAAGALRVGELLLVGSGPALLAMAAAGLAWLLIRWRRGTLVAALPGVGMLLICILLGAGKPAEFARFLILPTLLLCVAAGVILASLARQRPVAGILITVLVLGTMHTPAYVRSFAADARGTHESRRGAGLYLHQHAAPDDAIGVVQVPAPYAVPPLDFASGRVLLLPPARPAELDVPDLPRWLVFTADNEWTHASAWWQAYYRCATRFPSADTAPSPIAWANKPVFVYLRTP